MMKPKTTQKDNHEEARYDEAVKESFPASDAPAGGGATRIEDDGKERGTRRHDPNASSDDMDEPTGRDDSDK
ncbi:hypothetical protein VSR34_07045 [Paraburkholderia sp. JHI2823]|uniref:hypothetical protein n=1 Tax=Paraburkholderia sp. JHI2823 TaxID=3112960 RepID=UPI0031746F5D